jgi:hypothetical protein
MIPFLANANDRLFEIAGKSVPLRLGLNLGDGFPASEEQVVGLARLSIGLPESRLPVRRLR